MPADCLGALAGCLASLAVLVEVQHRTPAFPSPKREASTACAQPMRPAFFALELYPPPGPTLTSCAYRRSVGCGPAPISPCRASQTTVRLAGAAVLVVYSPIKQRLPPCLWLHVAARYELEQRWIQTWSALYLWRSSSRSLLFLVSVSTSSIRLREHGSMGRTVASGSRRRTFLLTAVVRHVPGSPRGSVCSYRLVACPGGQEDSRTNPPCDATVPKSRASTVPCPRANANAINQILADVNRGPHLHRRAASCFWPSPPILCLTC